MVRGVCRSQRANKLQRKDEKRASQEVTAVARETTKGEGRWVRATRHARAPTPRHTRRALTKGSQRDTHTRGGRRPHTALAEKKKGGWDPYTYSQPPAGRRRDRATDRYTTHEHARTTERKKKRERRKEKHPAHTHRHTQTHTSKATQRNLTMPGGTAGRTRPPHTKAGRRGRGRKKKKRKKKRGRDGRRRPPLLPPPHAAAVPAVSSRCLHPLYNAAAGGLTNRRPTSRHTSAASAARRSRQ